MCSKCLSDFVQGRGSTSTYLLATANVLQAVIEGAHPPLVVRGVGRFLLAQAKLVLLVRNKKRLLNASTLAIERVTTTLPPLLTQISLCVHRCEVVCGLLTAERSFFPSSNFFAGRLGDFGKWTLTMTAALALADTGKHHV